MAAWRYEISLLVLKKYFTRSLRSLVKYFSTLEEKFRISARPCNILYILNTDITLNGANLKVMLDRTIHTTIFSVTQRCIVGTML